MHPVEALGRLGGIASTQQLLAMTTRKRIRGALARGEIRRSVRGRYILPSVGQARRCAAAAGGHLILLSAAQHHDWEIRFGPDRPQVGLPHDRRPLVDLTSAEVRPWRSAYDGWATTPLATVLDCAEHLGFADGLAVADSALRHRAVGRDELLAAARTARQRRVAQYADGRAANPFESTLRAIAIDEGLGVLPQFEVVVRGMTLHPDLVDPVNGVVLEAESWEFHARDRAMFDSDCERYTELTIAGWLVLRFTWHDVMHRPERVRSCLRELYGPEGPLATPWPRDTPYVAARRCGRDR